MANMHSMCMSDLKTEYTNLCSSKLSKFTFLVIDAINTLLIENLRDGQMLAVHRSLQVSLDISGHYFAQIKQMEA